MKQSKLTYLIILASSMVVLTFPGYFVARAWWALSSQRRFLLKQVDHRAVAAACLDLVTKSEYQSLIGKYPLGDDPRLPPAIRAIKPFWLSVSSNEVFIVKTGGFYHMGYIFRPSALESNRYDLVFREEKDLEHDIPLSFVRRE